MDLNEVVWSLRKSIHTMQSQVLMMEPQYDKQGIWGGDRPEEPEEKNQL